MKLDNHGWGTKEMILISCALLLGLAFVAFSIYRLYNSVETIAPQYGILERTIKSDAVKYTKSNGKKSVITLKELKNSGYIEVFTDINDNPCDGYVLIRDNEYLPYISCEYYRTKGYDSKYNK